MAPSRLAIFLDQVGQVAPTWQSQKVNLVILGGMVTMVRDPVGISLQFGLPTAVVAVEVHGHEDARPATEALDCWENVEENPSFLFTQYGGVL